jgi:hypothetical protein
LRDLWINYRLLNEWQLQFGQFVVLSGLPRSVAGPRRLLTELRIAENGFSLAHANRVSAGTSQSSRDPDPALAGLRLLPR